MSIQYIIGISHDIFRIGIIEKAANSKKPTTIYINSFAARDSFTSLIKKSELSAIGATKSGIKKSKCVIIRLSICNIA